MKHEVELGVAEEERPSCVLGGTDGNVFAIIGNVSKSLKRNGMGEKAEEFQDRAFNSSSYDEVLRLVFEYVDVH